MGTILLIIVGIVVVMGIIGLALTVAKGALYGVGGIAFLVVTLVRHFPIPSILLIGAIIYTGEIIPACLLYAAAVIMLARDEAADEIKVHVLKIIEEHGIISKENAERITPSSSSPIALLTEAVHERGYGKKVLDQKVEKRELVLRRCGSIEYYCYEIQWDALQKEMVNKTTKVITDGFESSGVVSEELQEDIVSTWWYDLSYLAHIIVKRTFAQYMGELLKKDRVFVEEIEKCNQKIKLYISKEALSVKQQYIYGCKVIEGNDFVKLFGERDLIEQEAIMQAFSTLGNDMNYKLVTRDTDHFWIRTDAVKEHTCDGCNEIYRILTRYGKNQYCKPCMMKVHEQEDADEAEGKAVKRYISAPPPGVKIKM